MATFKVIQMQEKTDNGYIELYPVTKEKATITVTCESGATVTCVSSTGDTNLSYTYGSSETVHVFSVYEIGVQYTITASKSGSTSVSETFTVSNATDYAKTLAFFTAYIAVTSENGATVTCTLGSSSQSYTYTADGSHTFTVSSTGTYTLTATKSGQTSVSTTVSVTAETTYTATLVFISKTLNSNTWTQIRSVTDKSTQANYWSVGDVKMETIKGTIGILSVNGSYGFFILDLTHRASNEGNGIVFGGFKTAISSGKDIALCDSQYNSYVSTACFHMNSSSTNSGGWKSSYMRSTLMSQLLSAVTTDLQNNIRSSTIWSDNTGGGSDTASYVTSTSDKFYLLAEYEIFGSRSYANSAEKNYQAQMTYYKNGNSKVKYNHSSQSSAVYWWERSVRSSNSGAFCSVSTDGYANFDNAYFSNGFAPAFRL